MRGECPTVRVSSKSSRRCQAGKRSSRVGEMVGDSAENEGPNECDGDERRGRNYCRKLEKAEE